ncbi:MAG TPA: hypothetical protein VJT78_14325 [Candidatus Dormibacteraeota bacterium]|nr:hypothetical protein [Candidatus Dormibacteraeota bacterium]
MRRGFGLIGLVVTAIVLVIVGAIAYNIGWSDGLNTHLPAVTNGTAAAPPYYYGYGPHWGFGGPVFGILGFLWFLFVLFVIFAIFRFIFFGRRMWGGGGWGHGHGWYGGQGMPPGIEERMQDWHRRAHGEQPPTTPGSGTTPPPPPPDSRSV